jgi:hypothetical protein
LIVQRSVRRRRGTTVRPAQRTSLGARFGRCSVSARHMLIGVLVPAIALAMQGQLSAKG